MLPIERFTVSAQDASARAMEIIQRYGHDQMNTDHVLLALLEQPEGAVPQILEKLSVEQEQVKKRLEDELRVSPRPPRPLLAPTWCLSPRASNAC